MSSNNSSGLTHEEILQKVKETQEHFKNMTPEERKRRIEENERFKAQIQENNIYNFIFSYIYPVYPILRHLPDNYLLKIVIVYTPIILIATSVLFILGYLRGQAPAFVWIVIEFINIFFSNNPEIIFWITGIWVLSTYAIGYFFLYLDKNSKTHE